MNVVLCRGMVTMTSVVDQVSSSESAVWTVHSVTSQLLMPLRTTVSYNEYTLNKIKVFLTKN